ncbi:MAG: succinate dehydrogenase, cytochrome b556 subunit [Mariprofundaceae bacterium]|nr:succinate dehydrogenase, cytochrome b556 subunit [Mariprofundaceae bacterium]
MRTSTHQHTPPISPRLSIYRWRLTMLSSICHRASGMLLLLLIPALIWLLLTMSHNMVDFVYAMTWLHSPLGKLLVWLTCTSLLYHILNGIRFLCLDMGYGESRVMMRLSAKLVWLATLALAIVLAVAL